MEDSLWKTVSTTTRTRTKTRTRIRSISRRRTNKTATTTTTIITTAITTATTTATATIATRTATAFDEPTLMGINMTTWTWIIMALAAIGIVTLIWAYTRQQSEKNYNSYDK